MLKEHEDAKRPRALVPKETRMILIAGAVGIIIGVAATWAGTRPAIRVYEGTTTVVDAHGTAFGWRAPPGADAGYSVAGATWRELDSGWHIGDPASCLVPGHSPQAIRLGVMSVPSSAEMPGGDVVVWLECLDSPYGPN
jgi:hypothetical protein